MLTPEIQVSMKIGSGEADANTQDGDPFSVWNERSSTWETTVKNDIKLSPKWSVLLVSHENVDFSIGLVTNL